MNLFYRRIRQAVGLFYKIHDLFRRILSIAKFEDQNGRRIEKVHSIPVGLVNDVTVIRRAHVKIVDVPGVAGAGFGGRRILMLPRFSRQVFRF